MDKLKALFGLDPETAVLAGTLPFRKDPPGAREAVLLLHGFTGHPGELEAMGRALAEAGYAVYAPRYPGHGSRRADFLASDEADWARRAFDAYLELRADYPTVHVLGHSMGGLLATAVASVFSPPRLVLLAPAFRFRDPSLRFAPFLAPFLPVLRRGRPVPRGETEPTRARLHEEYRSDDLVASAAGLVRLRSRAEKRLPLVRSRILVLLGERDAAVSLEVGRLIESRASAAASVETRVLAGASHLFPFDERAGESSAIVAAWMGAAPASGA